MLFPIFVIATLAELYVLMTIGSSIGAGNTILLVIITAFIGSYLLKQQGLSTLKKVQIAAAQGNNPSFEMLEGVVIMFCCFLGFCVCAVVKTLLAFFSKKCVRKNARLQGISPNKPIESVINPGVTIGSSIGAGNTILLVIITAFIGSYLLKQQESCCTIRRLWCFFLCQGSGKNN
jgi:UPF0716 family protein affecting phage T7 exclusion